MQREGLRSFSRPQSPTARKDNSLQEYLSARDRLGKMSIWSLPLGQIEANDASHLILHTGDSLVSLQVCFLSLCLIASISLSFGTRVPTV